MKYNEAPSAQAYIDKARELHEIEGEIEIEEEVSRSEDGQGEYGAYVRARVWVNREELQPGYETTSDTTDETREEKEGGS